MSGKIKLINFYSTVTCEAKVIKHDYDISHVNYLLRALAFGYGSHSTKIIPSIFIYHNTIKKLISFNVTGL